MVRLLLAFSLSCLVACSDAGNAVDSSTEVDASTGGVDINSDDGGAATDTREDAGSVDAELEVGDNAQNDVGPSDTTDAGPSDIAEEDAATDSGDTGAVEDADAVDAAEMDAAEVDGDGSSADVDAADGQLDAAVDAEDDITPDATQDVAVDAGPDVTEGDATDADADGAGDVSPDGEADVAPSFCPGAGTTGNRPGNVLPDLPLTTCEGEVVSTHDLCGANVTAIIGFAQWCSSCRAKAPQIQALYASDSIEGAEVWFVVTQNASFEGADAALCAEVRARYGLTMPVFFDPGNAFRIGSGIPANDASIVLDSELNVVSNSQFRSAAQIESEMRAVVAP